jgi:CDP-diacylglycerol--glycerol-3-phosphate 3-phosphatidyltransferase
MSASSIKKDLFNLPNALTYLRVLLIPVVMWLIHVGTPQSCGIAAVLFTVAAITDFFDGYLARKLGLVSLTGKFLDPLADKLIVMASIIMLAAQGWIQDWLVVLVLTREMSVTELRALAATEGMLVPSDTWGKFKTAFQLVGLVALIIHYEYECDWGVFSQRISYHLVGVWLFGLSVAFSLYSGLNYFIQFLKRIDDAKSKA